MATPRKLSKIKADYYQDLRKIMKKRTTKNALALASPLLPKGEASAKGEGHEGKRVAESYCVSPNYIRTYAQITE
ncbi:hypothetical protein N9414_18278 [Nodularia spumigena CCY9414]|jgi:hypothetical protein|nr:hypothetical protein N9414_18278 [Nodularia spumigena CCY9414]